MVSAFYKKLFLKLPYGCAFHKIIKDANGAPYDYKFIDANSLFKEITGLRSKKLIGKKGSEIFIDSREQIYSLHDIYGGSQQAGKYKNPEWYSTIKNRYYSIKPVIFEDDCFAIIFEELAKSADRAPQGSELEGKFSYYAENANDVIYRIRLHPKRKYEYVSNVSTKITGYTPEDHYRDPYLGLKTVHPEDRQLLEDLDKGLCGTDEPVIIRWISKNGKVVWMEQISNPEYDDKGRLVAVDGIARDITLWQKAEEALRKKTAEAKKQLYLSEKLFQQPLAKLDYQMLVDEMLELAGAKYVIFDLYNESGNKFTNKAVAGVDQNTLKKIEKLLSFKILGNEWDVDIERMNQIKGGKLKKFSGIKELAYRKIPETVIGAVEKLTGTGKVYVIEINYSGQTLGDFIIIMPKNVNIQNKIIIESFASQVGQSLIRNKAEKALQLQFRFQQMIADISAGFVNILPENVDEMVYKALNMSGCFFKVDRAYVFKFSDDDKTITNTHEWCAENIESQKELFQKLPLKKLPWSIKQIQKMDCLYIPDISQLQAGVKTEELDFIKDLGVKSFLAVPIKKNGKINGFLGFDSVEEKKEWTKEQIILLNLLAEIISNAFTKQLSDITLKKSEYEKTIRNNILKLFLSVPDNNINKEILQIILKSTNSSIGVFSFLSGKQNEKYKARGCYSAVYASLDKKERLREINMGYNAESDFKIASCKSLDDFNLAKVPKNNGPVFYNEPIKVTKGQSPINSILVMPVIFEDKTIASFQIANKPRGYTAEDIDWMTGLAEFIAPILKTRIDMDQWEQERKMSEAELQKSEEKFRTLVENAFDGIYLMQDKHYEYVNQKFCEITGYDEKELTAKNFDFAVLIDKANKKYVLERFEARKKGAEISTSYETKIITKSGKIKNVEISTMSLGDPKNSRILGVMRDITERKRVEKLQQEVFIANKSAEFKQRFLANMSHEIRTPLTGIMGMAEILSKTNLDSKQIDYLNTIRFSTENLREIIDQILDYSKIEAGKMKLNPRVFRTFSLFDKSEKLFNSICNKDISFDYDIDSDLPEYLKADDQRIFQVISNLIYNAVKFTEKGSVNVTCQVQKRFDKKTLSVKINVIDTGIGIRPEVQKKLFRPFSQIDHEDTQNIEGTGLGLTICKQLTNLLGGRIGVDSMPGKGSRFWFTFKTEVAGKPKIKKSKALEEAPYKHEGVKVLHVEDKVVNQKVVSLMLKSMGCEVKFANNGKEALQVYEQDEFDIILMDIQMPVMDGVTATKELRKRYKSLPPIIGLSANAFEGDREKYMKLGMDEYLTKPIKTEDMVNILEHFKIKLNKKA